MKHATQNSRRIGDSLDFTYQALDPKRHYKNLRKLYDFTLATYILGQLFSYLVYACVTLFLFTLIADDNGIVEGWLAPLLALISGFVLCLVIWPLLFWHVCRALGAIKPKSK